MLPIIATVLGYLVGSVSSAVIVSRLMRLPDPRTSGSMNPGATNVLRLGSKPGAALTLAGDVAKGVLPVLIARQFSTDPLVIALAGLGAFLGHLYPLFFRFQGGKGVATALGVFAAVSPLIAAMQVATWLATAAAFRYSSLAALVTAAATPILVGIVLKSPPYLALSVVLGALLFWRHRSNIQRLLKGEETRIGEKK